jgi:hypothetical protein
MLSNADEDLELLAVRKQIFSVLLKRIAFWLYGARVLAKQHGNILHIQVHKRISQQLWDDVRLRIPFNKEGFIIGYLASYIPTINRYLLDNRTKLIASWGFNFGCLFGRDTI